MGRPKITEAGGKKAVEKFRKTMLELYGSEEAMREHYRQMGKKGGMMSSSGGFAANPELAKTAGRKGGSMSRGSYTKGYSKRWREIAPEAQAMYRTGEYSIREIAEKFDFGVSAMRRRLKGSYEVNHEIIK